MIYQVKNWDDNFENNKSREVEECSFVCVPNKQHGLGFSRLMEEPDGAAIYGIWILLLGICSRQRRARRGWLTEDGQRDGTPLAPQDVKAQIRRPVEEIERALAVLSSPRIGWIGAYARIEDAPKDPANKGRKRGQSNGTQLPANCPPTALEEKRIEENRIRFADAETVYDLYPRKVSKPHALHAIVKALKKEPLERLCGLVRQYADAVRGDDPQFIPHPATWFNGQRYNDDPATWIRRAGNAKAEPVTSQPLLKPL